MLREALLQLGFLQVLGGFLFIFLLVDFSIPLQDWTAQLCLQHTQRSAVSSQQYPEYGNQPFFPPGENLGIWETLIAGFGCLSLVHPWAPSVCVLLPQQELCWCQDHPQALAEVTTFPVAKKSLAD